MDAPQATRPALPRFGILLALMIADIMLGPLVPAREGGMWVAAVVMALILTAALVAVGLRRESLVLFGVAVASIAADVLARTPATVAVSLAARAVFLCYVEVRIIWRVLTDETITHDTVSAVACGYVMIGLVWGAFYALLEVLRPGSFVIPAAWVAGPAGEVRALAYFSFITLTSVGFGDILPTGAPGGGLCIGEAIVGQLYLAIMIARMVGILAGQRSS
jgi:Ion channel